MFFWRSCTNTMVKLMVSVANPWLFMLGYYGLNIVTFVYFMYLLMNQF